MATYIYKYSSHEEYLFLSHSHFLSPAYQKSLSKKHCHLAWETEKDELLCVWARVWETVCVCMSERVQMCMCG